MSRPEVPILGFHAALALIVWSLIAGIAIGSIVGFLAGVMG